MYGGWVMESLRLVRQTLEPPACWSLPTPPRVLASYSLTTPSSVAAASLVHSFVQVGASGFVLVVAWWIRLPRSRASRWELNGSGLLSLGPRRASTEFPPGHQLPLEL